MWYQTIVSILKDDWFFPFSKLQKVLIIIDSCVKGLYMYFFEVVVKVTLQIACGGIDVVSWMHIYLENILTTVELVIELKIHFLLIQVCIIFGNIRTVLTIAALIFLIIVIAVSRANISQNEFVFTTLFQFLDTEHYEIDETNASHKHEGAEVRSALILLIYVFLFFFFRIYLKLDKRIIGGSRPINFFGHRLNYQK